MRSPDGARCRWASAVLVATAVLLACLVGRTRRAPAAVGAGAGGAGFQLASSVAAEGRTRVLQTERANETTETTETANEMTKDDTTKDETAKETENETTKDEARLPENEGPTEPQNPLEDVVAKLEGEEQCGVFDDDDLERDLGPDLTDEDLCDRRLRSNCTFSMQPISCPDECSYTVFHKSLPCFFACTTAENCSHHNPDLAYPNPGEYGGRPYCAPCDVSLCSKCSSPSTCEICHKGFRLDPASGQCVVEYNTTAVTVVVYVIVAVVVGLLLLAILWTCIHKAHPRAKEHMMHLRRARRHRHLGKATRWTLNNPVHVRTWWTLGENMHATDIAGVGLPLVFNTLVFLMVLSLVFMFGMRFAFYEKDFSKLYEFLASHHGNASTADDIVKLEGRPPVTVSSKLQQCSTVWNAAPENIKEFGTRMVITISSLYVFAFLASLWFGRYQKKYAEWFDKVTPSMSDYALRVTNLPPEETDEPKLREAFQEMFRKALPQKIARPDHVEFLVDQEEDKVVSVEPGLIQVEAVSIAYEYMERRGEVDDTLWKMMEVFEVDLYQKAKDVPRNKEAYTRLYEGLELSIDSTSLFDPTDPLTHGMTTTAAHAKIKEKADMLFKGDDRLKGTGVAYVVFKYIRDKEEVERYIEKDPQAFKLGDNQLTFEPVFTEPTGISWWSHGITTEKLYKNIGLTLLKVFLLIFLLEVCIVLPYWYFIRKPFQDAGTTATGTITTLYGIIIGNLNGLVYWLTYMISEGIGFEFRDNLFGFATAATIFVMFGMNSFNIGLDARVVRANYGDNELSMSVGMITHFTEVLPSAMFAGRPMNVVMPTVQYCWFQALAKILYVWKCLPDSLLKLLVNILPFNPNGSIDHWPFRNAEKMASPWQMPITAEFADIVFMSTMCFSMLTFISSSSSYFFALLCGWGVYIYVYVRYAYLRFHGQDFFTTTTAFCWSWFLWGIPLSVVGAQIPHWIYIANRADGEEEDNLLWCSTVCGSFIASYALWLNCYHFLVQPFKQADVIEQDVSLTVAEAKMHRVYDWLNCNPVFALKCRYHFQDAEGADSGLLRGHPVACGENPAVVRFYEIGKEYLFLRPQRQYLVERNVSNWLEPEYWTDRASSGLARIFAPLLTHVQADQKNLRGISRADDETAPLVP